MKIISWNVNGIRAAAKKGLEDYFKNENADIFCLQETKAFPEQLPDNLKQPEGYHSYWHKGKRPGYSGVVTYSKKEAVNHKAEFENGLESFSEEGRVVETQFQDFVLLNIYFPNGGTRADGKEMLSYKLNFYKLFLDYINKLKSEGKSIIACGDYNIAHTEIDIARPKENEDSIGFLPEERAWITKILDNGYIDAFRLINKDVKDSYTWWSYRTKARERNIGWRIDYFIISNDLADKVKNVSHQIEILGSDHCPILMEIEI